MPISQAIVTAAAFGLNRRAAPIRARIPPATTRTHQRSRGGRPLRHQVMAGASAGGSNGTSPSPSSAPSGSEGSWPTAGQGAGDAQEHERGQPTEVDRPEHEQAEGDHDDLGDDLVGLSGGHDRRPGPGHCAAHPPRHAGG